MKMKIYLFINLINSLTCDVSLVIYTEKLNVNHVFLSVNASCKDVFYTFCVLLAAVACSSSSSAASSSHIHTHDSFFCVIFHCCSILCIYSSLSLSLFISLSRPPFIECQRREGQVLPVLSRWTSYYTLAFTCTTTALDGERASTLVDLNFSFFLSPLFFFSSFLVFFVNSSPLSLKFLCIGRSSLFLSHTTSFFKVCIWHSFSLLFSLCNSHRASEGEFSLSFILSLSLTTYTLMQLWKDQWNLLVARWKGARARKWGEKRVTSAIRE